MEVPAQDRMEGAKVKARNSHFSAAKCVVESHSSWTLINIINIDQHGLTLFSMKPSSPIFKPSSPDACDGGFASSFLDRSLNSIKGYG